MCHCCCVPARLGRHARTRTHRVVNTQPGPVFLDQIVLQYWFHGPLDGGMDAATANSTNSTTGSSASTSGSSASTSGGAASSSLDSGSGIEEVVARVSASQFRLTCSDATPEVGKCWLLHL